MNDTRRAAGIAGVIALVLIAVGFLAAGTPPKLDDPTTKVVRYFADHRSALAMQTLLTGLATPLLLWFIGAVHGLLSEAEGPVHPLATAFLAGTLLLLALFATGSLLGGTVAWRGAEQLDGATVRFAFDAWMIASYAGTAGAAFTSVAAPCVVIWRSGVLPRWIVWVGLVEMAANVVELIGIFARRGSLAAGSGAGLVAVPAWVVFFICIAVAMTRTRQAATARVA